MRSGSPAGYSTSMRSRISSPTDWISAATLSDWPMWCT
jgi:hypothetical protein